MRSGHHLRSRCSMILTRLEIQAIPVRLRVRHRRNQAKRRNMLPARPNSTLGRERVEEVPDLVVDLGGVVESGGNFPAEQLSEAASQAVCGNAGGPFSRAQASGDVRIGSVVGASPKPVSQRLEGLLLPRLVVLTAELVEDPPQEGQCPGPVEDALRG